MSLFDFAIEQAATADIDMVRSSQCFERFPKQPNISERMFPERFGEIGLKSDILHRDILREEKTSRPRRVMGKNGDPVIFSREKEGAYLAGGDELVAEIFGACGGKEADSGHAVGGWFAVIGGVDSVCTIPFGPRRRPDW